MSKPSWTAGVVTISARPPIRASSLCCKVEPRMLTGADTTRRSLAVKDKSYRATPLGLEVAHFMRWFRNEYGATSETLRDYEAILAKLAIDHADLELADFEPP